MGKKLEYRDTFDFRLFPDYAYTKAQNRRFRLFQGRVEHWRAAVNYADRFSDPNRINLLYLIGYHPKIKDHMDKTANNTVVLSAHVPSDYLEKYDAYWNLIKQYQGCGYADKDGNLLPFYYDERSKREKYRGTGFIPDEVSQCYDTEDQIIDTYEAVKDKILDCFKTYTVIDKLGPERTISCNDLDKLVYRYFPYGRERCGLGEKAYISLRKTADALKAGLHREDASKILDLPSGTDSYTACIKPIRRCQMNINTALRNDGWVDLISLVDLMRRPPYGWDNEPCAAYCVGYALSDRLDDTWIWDGLSCFPGLDAMEAVIRDILHGLTQRRKSYVLIEESGYHLSARFAYLFDMDNDSYMPRDDVDRRIVELLRSGLTERKISAELGTISNVAVHKRITKMRMEPKENIPFCDMAHKVCQKIEQMTRWPVAIVDENLHDALNGVYDAHSLESFGGISVPIFGRRAVNNALAYFTPEKCKALKEKLEHINEYAPSLLRERYGENINVDEILRYHTTSSSGWLWDSEFFWNHLDKELRVQ